MYDGQLARRIASSGFEGRVEVPLAKSSAKKLSVITAVLHSLPRDAVILERFGLDEWRRLGGAAYRTAQRRREKSFAISLRSVSPGHLERVTRAVVEGARLAGYAFTAFKKNGKKREVVPEEMILLLDGKQTKGIGEAIDAAVLSADATMFVRDLVNMPPSDLNPNDLVRHAREIARQSRGRVRAKIYDARALSKMGAHALLAVGRGSDVRPHLLHLTYRPKSKKKGRKTIVLVGKGITFDSGGLSIKTGKGMEDMKCDMAGAACVLAVMRALSRTKQKIRHEIHAIVPTAENMINGLSVKPGDIVHAMNGKSIEILNTDAEGRLILADALSYCDRLNPDLIVDLATLTGACVVALGSEYAGLFSNNKELEHDLRTSAGGAGERLWPLPLAKEYRSHIDSPVADLRNISLSGGPGAIIGALFLEEFVPKNTPWAHLDIAGPAFGSSIGDYGSPGGTGFGVRTLLRFLEHLERSEIRYKKGDDKGGNVKLAPA